jgi:hypothetical protein
VSLELVSDEIEEAAEEVRSALEWAEAKAMAGGWGLDERDRQAAGDQLADGGEAGRGVGAAALFAGAGGVDAGSTGAGAAQADR